MRTIASDDVAWPFPPPITASSAILLERTARAFALQHLEITASNAHVTFRGIIQRQLPRSSAIQEVRHALILVGT